MPEIATTFRGDLAPPLLWLARLRCTHVTIVSPSVVLSSERPRGWNGGGIAVGSVGLVLDTRDRERWTRRGLLADASILASPRLGRLSDFATLGVNGTVRGYLPLWREASLAGRGLAEVRGGDVPFFEWTTIEGLLGGEGLGGATSIRGVARDRIEGPAKLLANLELRQTLATFRLLDRLVDVGAAAGCDAGWARQPGHVPAHGAGVFLTVRMLIDRAASIRFDVAYAGIPPPAVYLSVEDAY